MRISIHIGLLRPPPQGLLRNDGLQCSEHNNSLGVRRGQLESNRVVDVQNLYTTAYLELTVTVANWTDGMSDIRTFFKPIGRTTDSTVAVRKHHRDADEDTNNVTAKRHHNEDALSMDANQNLVNKDKTLVTPTRESDLQDDKQHRRALATPEHTYSNDETQHEVSSTRRYNRNDIVPQTHTIAVATSVESSHASTVAPKSDTLTATGDSSMVTKSSGKKPAAPFRPSARQMNAQLEWTVEKTNDPPLSGHLSLYLTDGAGQASRSDGDRYVDKWDENHVLLPCSPNNVHYHKVVPTDDRAPKYTKISNWSRVCAALSTPINDICGLVKALQECADPQKAEFMSYSALIDVFDLLDDEKESKFFSHTMPKLLRLALDLPKLCPTGIPLLRRGCSAAVSFTNEQVLCLMVHAFFNTFPEFGRQHMNRFCMQGLYEQSYSSQIGKLRCLLHYFEAAVDELHAEPATQLRVVTIARRKLTNTPKWDSVRAKIVDLEVKSTGFIEDCGVSYSQADFANKYIGGGVLGRGAVQEEIRFVICPELIISCLICESMNKSDSIIMKGAKRFSKYSGYADSFQWTGPFKDDSPMDSRNRLETQVFAMDAIFFGQRRHAQYKMDLVDRELNKCLSAFDISDDEDLKVSKRPVATGNWGCGVFGGDPEFKALIQLCACSSAGENMLFFSFGDQKFSEQFKFTHELLQDRDLKVSELYALLDEYCALKSIRQCHASPLQFIASKVSDM